MTHGIDPYYNGLYSQTHGAGLYGTSSIAFLPEVMQAFCFYVAGKQIDLLRPVKVLDYGCGQSVLLDVFAKAVNENRDTILKINESSFSQVMSQLGDSLAENMRGLDRNDYARLLTWDGGIVEKHRFDPAIPEYAAPPQGPYDFVICTDVFEHIPEYSSDGKQTPVLAEAEKKVLGLSDNIFLNVSTRLAMQILSDGQNAHCTLKTPATWQKRLQSVKSDIAPMFSRDLTSCHFVRGDLCQDFHQASYNAWRRFGEVDLIAWPPAAGKVLTKAKEDALLAVQPHKQEIRARNLSWWKRDIDPSAPV